MRVLALICLVAASLAARRAQEPFMGFKELHTSTSQGRRHSQSFTHTDEQGTTSLIYEAEQREDKEYLYLDTHTEVKDVDCSKLYHDQGSLLVTMASEEAAQALLKGDKPLVVLGGVEWGCMKEDNVMPIMHHVDDAKLINQDGVVSLSLEVSMAHYTDVFENAEIEFFTDKFPENHFVEEAAPALDFDRRSGSEAEAEVEVGSGVFGWIGGFLQRTWDGARNLGNQVNNALRAVRQTVARIAAGNYNLDRRLNIATWRWNANAQNRVINDNIQIDGNVACRGCSARATLNVQFAITIQNRRLTRLRLVSEGTAVATLGLRGTWTRSLSRSNERILATIRTPNVPFMLGPVPMTLGLAIPIAVGYNLDASATAVIQVRATATATISFGITFTPANGVRLVNSARYTHTGNINEISGQINAGLVVYVRPTAQMIVSFIGGPNVGLMFFAEVAAEANLRRGQTCFNRGGIHVGSNVGLQVTVGAAIDIGFPGLSLLRHEAAPRVIFSNKRPLLNGCISARRFANELPTVVNVSDDDNTIVLTGHGALEPEDVFTPWCLVGNTWEGVMSRGPGRDDLCRAYDGLNRELSIQILDANITEAGPILTLMASVNDDNSENANNDTYACMNQMLMRGTLRGVNLFFEVLDTPGFSSCTKNETCSCVDPTIGLRSGVFAVGDRDFTNLMLEDNLKCSQIKLTRQFQETPMDKFFTHLAEDEEDVCLSPPIDE